MQETKPTRTESTFSSNEEVKRLAGYSNVNRGSIKDISIALYDVDFAIKWHLENKVQPTVTEENTIITGPVLFSTGEKWAAVQKHGYLRDNQGKILTPLIMIKRNAITKREDLQDIKVLETADERITFEKKYSSRNRYDRFSLLNNKVPTEYYSVDVPKFVQVEYEIVCWTNNVSQLNEIIEQLIWFDGKAFGDTHKFNTYIDTPSFESVNTTGEDRIQRATLPMRTKAHILNTRGPNAPAMYKLNPVNKLVIGMETESTSFSTGGRLPSNTTVIVSGGGSSSGSSTSMNSVVIYLSVNVQLTGSISNLNTVVFPSEWLTAPSPLDPTSVNNFTFFVNGQMLEKTAIHSFTQQIGQGLSTLVIDTINLGFDLSTNDEIIGIGKFINQDSLA